MNKHYDIIINTLFPTDNIYSSVSLSFAKEMAKTNRVFYINHPYSIKDAIKNWNNKVFSERFPRLLLGKPAYETHPNIPDNFVAATPPLTIPINFLSHSNFYDALHHLNRQIFLNTIEQVKKDYNIKNFIYLTCFDPFFVPVLPDEYGAFLNIYQSIDDISTEPYIAKHGVRLEREAAMESDITLVTSTHLKRIFTIIQPETYMLHNAVDINIFDNLYYRDIEKPAEIAHIKNKIIGFVGNLDNVRIDYKLLHHLAVTHPDKTLLLVGPINSQEVYTEGLDRIPNVILAGGKSIYDVPQYLKYMDVAILPSLLNKMSRAVYPLKINEYLAAGKSVISTNFSDDIRNFQPHIRIAQSHEHFSQLINEAIADYPEDKVKTRMAIAANNTWGNRIAEFWDIVEMHLYNTKKLKWRA